MPQELKIAILYTTVDSIKNAETLAAQAVEQKYAACVNIIPDGKSIYLWNGVVETNLECYVIFKTSLEMLDKLEGWLLKNHPYDVPAILKSEAATHGGFFDYITRVVN